MLSQVFTTVAILGLTLVLQVVALATPCPGYPYGC